jgi:hypothetical protein
LSHRRWKRAREKEKEEARLGKARESERDERPKGRRDERRRGAEEGGEEPLTSSS